MGIFSDRSESDFRKYLKLAKKSEGTLIKYYKKNFIKHTRRLDELYKNHLESLKRIDGSMGAMNSMIKIFKEELPNGMKQRNISIESIKNYINADTNMKIKDYNINSSTTKMDFSEQHIKRQCEEIINRLFEKKHTKNIKQIIVIIKEPDTGEEEGIYRKSYVKEGQYTILGLKTGIKRDSANILNLNLLEVVLIFKLNNGKGVKHTIPHIGLKIIKDKAYEIIKKMIESTLEPSEQITLKSFAKQQDKKLKSIIFEEQKKILEDQVQELDKEGDNQKILLNIVKRIHRSSKDKSYMDDFGVRSTANRGRYGSSGGISFGSRTELSNNADTTIERKLEDQIDMPLAELDEEEQNERDKLFEANVIGTDDPDNIPELMDMFPNSKKKGGRSYTRKKNQSINKNRKISPHNNIKLTKHRKIKNKTHKLNQRKNKKIRKNKSIKNK